MNEGILSGLKPEKVFRFFEEISAVPRGSGKTAEIRAYCERFAESRGLKYISDKSDNIIIFKPACGCESDEPIIIQGHLDMVWEKDADCGIDFESDGLKLAVDSDSIYAKGTTLGGDDGIAVAMCLALLDSDDICHPALEIVFTSDEEIGMVGAFGIDVSCLKGKRMINLDSEDEGTLWVSCAGGVRVDLIHSPQTAKPLNEAYKITVSGLHGGHSGAEIHKGYANANVILGRVLCNLKSSVDFVISEINGGTMDNAITRESSCVICSDKPISAEMISAAGGSSALKFNKTEPEMRIAAIAVSTPDFAMTAASTESLVSLLCELPNGVIAMSDEIEGLVETSLNLGIMKSDCNRVEITFSVRSGKDEEREKLVRRLCGIAESYGCEYRVHSEYPAWEYKKDSALRETMACVYREMYGNEMKITAIHAGLECGLFCGKIKGLDCVSVGPDIFDIHTPHERLSISSVQRLWDYLLKVLEAL